MRFEVTLLIVIAAFTASSSAKTVNFTDCGAEMGELVSVDITPCDADLCVLKKGSTAKVTIAFLPHEAVNSGEVKVFVVVGNLPKLPYGALPPDLCKNYGLSCPLPSGEHQEIMLEIEVAKQLPDWEIQFIAEILDQSGKILVCGQFDVQISDWSSLTDAMFFYSCSKTLEDLRDDCWQCHEPALSLTSSITTR